MTTTADITLIIRAYHVPGVWLLSRLGLRGVRPLCPGLPLAASGLVLLSIVAAVLLLVGLDQLLDRGLLGAGAGGKGKGKEQVQEQGHKLLT